MPGTTHSPQPALQLPVYVARAAVQSTDSAAAAPAPPPSPLDQYEKLLATMKEITDPLPRALPPAARVDAASPPLPAGFAYPPPPPPALVPLDPVPRSASAPPLAARPVVRDEEDDDDEVPLGSIASPQLKPARVSTPSPSPSPSPPRARTPSRPTISSALAREIRPEPEPAPAPAAAEPPSGRLRSSTFTSTASGSSNLSNRTGNPRHRSRDARSRSRSRARERNTRGAGNPELDRAVVAARERHGREAVQPSGPLLDAPWLDGSCDYILCFRVRASLSPLGWRVSREWCSVASPFVVVVVVAVLVAALTSEDSPSSLASSTRPSLSKLLGVLDELAVLSVADVGAVLPVFAGYEGASLLKETTSACPMDSTAIDPEIAAALRSDADTPPNTSNHHHQHGTLQNYEPVALDEYPTDPTAAVPPSPIRATATDLNDNDLPASVYRNKRATVSTSDPATRAAAAAAAAGAGAAGLRRFPTLMRHTSVRGRRTAEKRGSYVVWGIAEVLDERRAYQWIAEPYTGGSSSSGSSDSGVSTSTSSSRALRKNTPSSSSIGSGSASVVRAPARMASLMSLAAGDSDDSMSGSTGSSAVLHSKGSSSSLGSTASASTARPAAPTIPSIANQLAAHAAASGGAPPPHPWQLDVRAHCPPLERLHGPDVQTNAHAVSVEVPGTALLMPCYTCNVRGLMSCGACADRLRCCAACRGTGTSRDGSMCGACGGLAVDVCASCANSGRVRCAVCLGHRAVRVALVVRVVWTRHSVVLANTGAHAGLPQQHLEASKPLVELTDLRVLGQPAYGVDGRPRHPLAGVVERQPEAVAADLADLHGALMRRMREQLRPGEAAYVHVAACRVRAVPVLEVRVTKRRWLLRNKTSAFVEIGAGEATVAGSLT
ncbi:hypothetical protein H9P43_004713 [Blastocladiella emersonii ATCC 22665]|nr:hypothetical protein H9P43_004713 [Blastocladiella emersonii ATCC 22665]